MPYCYTAFQLPLKITISPAQHARFSGIEVDSLELKFPKDKLEKLRTVLRSFEGRRKVSRNDLKRIAGLFAHYAKVILDGLTVCI